MNGKVDSAGRALVAITLRSSKDGVPEKLSTWVDTAFTGELVIPRKTIDRLGLRQSAAVEAHLADGSEVVLETYSCVVDWFGDERAVEVIANNGQLPLLGVGLLSDRKLVIDYRKRILMIE